MKNICLKELTADEIQCRSSKYEVSLWSSETERGEDTYGELITLSCTIHLLKWWPDWHAPYINILSHSGLELTWVSLQTYPYFPLSAAIIDSSMSLLPSLRFDTKCTLMRRGFSLLTESAKSLKIAYTFYSTSRHPPFASTRLSIIR